MSAKGKGTSKPASPEEAPNASKAVGNAIAAMDGLTPEQLEEQLLFHQQRAALLKGMIRMARAKAAMGGAKGGGKKPRKVRTPAAESLPEPTPTPTTVAEVPAEPAPADAAAR